MEIGERRIVVVDVGCRWGFAENFLPAIDRFLIYGFDPDQEECQRLNVHYSSPTIKAVPIALGRETCKKTLYLTKEPACSSLYKPDPYLTSNYSAFHCEVEVGQTCVNVQRLDDWIRENDVKVIDHLKIDTQGSELDILVGAGELLSSVRSVQAEVEFDPMYLAQPIFSDVDTFLRSKGFVLWKFSEITHYSKNKAPQPPIHTVDIRYDDWVSQTSGVYAGQIFWANAHYVSCAVFSGKKSTEDKERDQILFSLLGMPDVLGDQQEWGDYVNSIIRNNCLAASEQVTKLAKAINRSQQAEARATQAEARATQAEVRESEARAQAQQALTVAQHAQAQATQAEARVIALLNSTSWRVTAPLRWLGSAMRTLNPDALKPRAKVLLQHAALYVGRRPRLKNAALKVLNRFPSLKSWLFQIVTGVKTQPVQPQIVPTDIAHLTPHARQIYADLKSAIERRQKERG